MSVLYRSWVLLLGYGGTAGEGKCRSYAVGARGVPAPVSGASLHAGMRHGANAERGADHLPLRPHAARRHDRGERRPRHRRFRGPGDRAERDGEEEIEVHVLKVSQTVLALATIPALTTGHGNLERRMRMQNEE